MTTLAETTLKLINEVFGLAAFESEIREIIGNTNWEVLALRTREARAALSRPIDPKAEVEPVAWIAQSRWEQMTSAEPWLTNTVYSEDQSPIFPCVPLYASPSIVAPVGVKPLEWKTDGSWSWGSGTLSGVYSVRPCLATKWLGQWLLVLNETRIGDFFPDAEAAKAAAQADYESRILSALSPVTSVDAGDELTPDEAWQELCDRDDRTSPEEYPDMCLITREELAGFMLAAAPALTPAEKADGDLIEHAAWLEACATNEPSESDAGRLWQIAQLLRALSTTKPAQGGWENKRFVPLDKHEALMDSQYRAGAAAGWNAAQIPDDEAREKKFASLIKYNKGDLAAILMDDAQEERNANS